MASGNWVRHLNIGWNGALQIFTMGPLLAPLQGKASMEKAMSKVLTWFVEILLQQGGGLQEMVDRIGFNLCDLSTLSQS